MTARRVLIVSLALLAMLYVAWFGSLDEWIAAGIFAVPVLACLAGAAPARRTAGFWSGVLALAWFSPGVMVAWSRPPERGWALAEVALSLTIVIAGSLPGLRARFGRRR